jgi:RecB family exonuclease
MERGSALHWVMEQYFQRYPDSSTALSQPTTVIEELCQQAIARYKHLPEPFVGAEQTRLTQLVTDWLAIEAERTPFRVAETEQRYALELGDLAFSLRIDRLDDVDGAMVLIDYKTGRVSTGPALGESPTAPQLPSYSLIRDDIAGVYYAQVRSTEQKLIGLAGEAEQLTESPNARVKTTPTESGWVQQQALWRQQLIGLATEIAAGDARVNPLPNACRHCDLKPLCRVDEKRRDPEQSA